MIPVRELRLVRPIEVRWSGIPMPQITLRNPEMVHYDPATRLLHVNTGADLVLMPLDAEAVDRLVLEQVSTPSPSSPQPSPSSAPAETPSVLVRKKTR